MESRPLKWTTMGLLTIVLLSGVTCYWLLFIRVINGGGGGRPLRMNCTFPISYLEPLSTDVGSGT